MKRFLREPLLHFLVLGVGLFVAYGALNRSGSSKSEIVVTVGQIEHLTTGFTRSWRRPPSAEELNDLIRSYIREEVYYRQAREMGLDRDDPIIRRRLQQKLEFVSEDVAAQSEPSESDLEALLHSQSEKFRVGLSYTFTHIYLNPDRHVGNLAADAETLLLRLKKGGATADASALGDRFLLETNFEAIPDSEVAKLFGTAFSNRLAELPVGTWQGPLKSGYGLHFVFVKQRTDGRVPVLGEVREAVIKEWKEAQRKNANEDVYKKLLGRYSIIIEASPTGTIDLAGPALAQR
jgi:hypothetical protein